MKSYPSGVPRRELPEGVRLVHNFFPGPPEDPGRNRKVGLNGFRIWITDEPPGSHEHRCHCGWLDGREHYGTVWIVNEEGAITNGRGETPGIKG